VTFPAIAIAARIDARRDSFDEDLRDFVTTGATVGIDGKLP
jgi:hypothetical protein